MLRFILISFLSLLFSLLALLPPKTASAAQVTLLDTKSEAAKGKNKAQAKRRKRKRPPFLALSYNPKTYRFWLNYFSSSKREHFIKGVKNALKYRQVVEGILRRARLPQDLFYVALVESGYRSSAISRAKAVGPWQFMKGTAREYGLRVGRHIDERENIYKATLAAAHYLKDLYNIFGHWELALLAYNKGEYGLLRAIKKGNTRNYKKLVRKGLLPRETAHYIPKIAAARTVFKQLMGQKHFVGKVNRELGEELGHKHFYKRVRRETIRRSFSLAKVSKRRSISLTKLTLLNPDLPVRRITSPGRRGIHLYLPTKAPKIGEFSRAPVPLSPRRPFRLYRVKKGDSLMALARRFDVSLGHLKRLNRSRLKGRYLLSGQKLRIPSKNAKVYIVRRGDNLGSIARRFGTPIEQLIRYNAFTSLRIYPRQKIYIPVGA